MGDVIRLTDYLDGEWKEVLALDGDNSTLQVYVNKKTGQAEVVQMNDDNEAIRTVLNPIDVQLLQAALGAVNKASGT